MRVGEVARAAGVTRACVHQAIRNGQLCAHKRVIQERNWYISTAAAERWIATREPGAANAPQPADELNAEQLRVVELIGGGVLAVVDGVAVVTLSDVTLSVARDGRLV